MTGQPMTRFVAPLLAAVLGFGALARSPAPSRTAEPTLAAALAPEIQARSAGERHGPSAAEGAEAQPPLDYWSMVCVFMLATFIGIGVIRRVSRLLHTPLMSLTNAISAIAVVGSIIVTGSEHPPIIRVLGAIALFASTTNIVSGFLITDRMLRMFKGEGGRRSSTR